MAAPPVLATAEANSHALALYLNMSDEKWAEVSADTMKMGWWHFLKVGRPAAVTGNVAAKLSTLRSVFTNSFIDRRGTKWVRHLLEGQVQCTACSARTSTGGIMQCSTDHVGRHVGHVKHKRLVRGMEKSNLQRIDHMPFGVQPAAALAAARDPAHTAVALVVGSFAAGTHGAAGLPPTAIPKLLNQHMLGMLQHGLHNGIPTGPTITSTTLPHAVELVEERIKSLIRDKAISLYIDGGSSDLADGRKVVCVCASSLEVGVGTVLLDLQVFESHETSDTQAEQIEALVKKYDIKPENLHYLCADNASPNKATVDKLNAKGYKITYARCLPHCLNLVVRAFMNAMDKEFKFTTNLKLMRHFLTAGGGVARKLMALEFGFTISAVDFCDTRWASLVFAILYVANKQTPAHLNMAKKRLQELASQGDATAKDALDRDDGEAQVIFNVLHDFVESVLEEDLGKRKEMDDVDAAEASLPEAKKKLLRYFSQPLNYLGFQLIDIILGGDVGDKTEKLPSLFSITQGNPSYAARLKSSVTGEVPNAVHATRNLLARLKGLHYRWTGEDADVDVGSAAEQAEKKNVKGRLQRVFEELQRRAAAQATAVVRNCEVNAHDIKDKDEPFDQASAEAWMAQQADLYKDKLQPKLEAALAAAVLAVDGAAGLLKTEECVTGLAGSQVFDMNKRPTTFDDDSKLLQYLGFKGHYPTTEHVVAQWREYVGDWRQPAEPMSPTVVYAAWQGKLDSMPELARHAMREFSRPISAAACERVFSYLEHMDRSDRRRMQKELLRNNLFLHGNHEIMAQLLEEANAARVLQDAASAKRARKQQKK